MNTSQSQFPTMPPEPIEAEMRERFAYVDAAELERLRETNERLTALLLAHGIEVE